LFPAQRCAVVIGEFSEQVTQLFNRLKKSLCCLVVNCRGHFYCHPVEGIWIDCALSPE